MVGAGDQCGNMLTDSGMGGMDEMGIYYDHCLETLYPRANRLPPSHQPLAAR